MGMCGRDDYTPSLEGVHNLGGKTNTETSDNTEILLEHGREGTK